jgi:Methyltransferase domain
MARLAADRVGPTGQVVGQDLNPGMLAVALSLPAGVTPIAWVQASTDHLPFADGSFDVVACQLGLQYFPGRPGGPPRPRRDLPGPVADLERAGLPDRGPAAQRPRSLTTARVSRATRPGAAASVA